MTVKDLIYATNNSLNPLYLVINKINGYIEESNENRYLFLVPTDEGKGALKKYYELWNKIRDLTRSRANNWENYDDKCMKIKPNSDDNLPLKKILKLCNMIIVVRPVFHEGNKYHPQVFLDECLHKYGGMCANKFAK